MKLYLSGLLSLAIVLLVFGAGMIVGMRRVPAIEQVQILSSKETPVDIASEGKVDFAPFWQAWRTLDEKFMPAPEATTTLTIATTTASSSSVHKLATTQDRVWGAIEGMTKALGDPYTTFFPPEENKAFNEELSGEFGGVGMEVGLRKNTLTVIAPLEGTPAMRAGIRAGDRVLSIDGESTLELSVEEAVRRIRGPKGKAVKLTILREGEEKVREVSIIRDTINVPTLRTSRFGEDGKPITPETGIRPGGVFVIKLMSFSAQSPQLFRNALNDFNDAGTNKMIIDLRGNPGGFLEAAVDIASWFLPDGVPIVTEKFGKSSKQNIHRSKGYASVSEGGAKLKLAVLIDKGSASASEILAGALQDHKAAVVIGEKSFGKGSVQELVPLTSGTSLKITVARWFTPNGHSISDNGLTPDVIASTTEKDLSSGLDPVLLKAISLLTK